MHNPAIRSLIGVIAGVATAALVIAGVEAIGHSLFPPPPGFDPGRAGDRAGTMDLLPMGAKAAAVLAWFLGSLAGACVAIAISRRTLPAWIVAVVIAGLGLWTTQMFPHPDWMLASAVVLPLVAVLLAKLLMITRLADV